jgi:hypothetical protein
MTEQHFNVEDQEGYVREYDEDELIQIRKGDLRALLDVATGSMDFGSGFWTEEQTEVARRTARILGIDPVTVTPSNMTCTYAGEHRWTKWEGVVHVEGTPSRTTWAINETTGKTDFTVIPSRYFIRCGLCGHTEQIDRPDAPRSN